MRLVRYAAPVLVFTAEEVWGTRYPGRRAACICWYGRSARWQSDEDGLELTFVHCARTVNEAIEPLRREKVAGLRGWKRVVAVPETAADGRSRRTVHHSE